jgi:alanine transaminase
MSDRQQSATTTKVEIAEDDDTQEILPAKAFLGSKRQKRLTETTMSPNLRKMEYAVRGSVVIAADKINEELQMKSTKKKYPFDKIVYTNIGNPQSIGQEPLTWPRQVMALVDLPSKVGIDHPDAAKLFPADAIERAREIKEKALSGHGSGAYSHSKGAKMFREDVCAFLKERDGEEVPTDPEDIFLANGASAAIVSFCFHRARPSRL